MNEAFSTLRAPLHLIMKTNHGKLCYIFLICCAFSFVRKLLDEKSKSRDRAVIPRPLFEKQEVRNGLFTNFDCFL